MNERSQSVFVVSWVHRVAVLVVTASILAWVGVARAELFSEYYQHPDRSEAPVIDREQDFEVEYPLLWQAAKRSLQDILIRYESEARGRLKTDWIEDWDKTRRRGWLRKEQWVRRTQVDLRFTPLHNRTKLAISVTQMDTHDKKGVFNKYEEPEDRPTKDEVRAEVFGWITEDVAQLTGRSPESLLGITPAALAGTPLAETE